LDGTPSGARASKARDAGANGGGDPAGPGADAATGPREADAWLGTDRAATFRAHVAVVASVQRVSREGLARLGVTWDAELTRVEALYRDARSRADAYYALVALKNSFHDGHVYLLAGDLAPRAPALVSGVRVRAEQDGYVLREAGNPAVTSVDGRPMAEVERELRTWYARGSSPEGLREEVARWLEVRIPTEEPSPTAGARTRLGLRGAGGDTVREVTWTSAPPSPDADCPPYAETCGPDADGDYAGTPTFTGLGYCVYDGGAADMRVVRYRTLYYPDASDPAEGKCLERKLPKLSYGLTLADAKNLGPRGLLKRDQEELLSRLANTGVSRVLFDVRENTGGDFDPVFFGAFTRAAYRQPLKSFVYGAAFKQDPTLVARSEIYMALLDGQPVAGASARIEQHLRANPTAPASPDVPFYCTTTACAATEASLTPQSNVTFRAAVLTGPRCFSACDDLVSIFKDNGIATTIGLPTGAGDAPYAHTVDLPLANGAVVKLRLTVGVSYHPGTRTPLEGNPAPVDVPLAPSAVNRGRYLAEAIARARF